MRAATSDGRGCREPSPKPAPGAKTIVAATKTARRARIKGLQTSVEATVLYDPRVNDGHLFLAAKELVLEARKANT
jgi:hypothetical protein